MRQLQRDERGSANWPFIIALLLLLAFVYMWFTEKDEREQAVDVSKTAQEDARVANLLTQYFVDYARELSKDVGWDVVQASAVVPTEADPAVKAKATGLYGDQYFTDLGKLRANLTPDGTTEDGKKGLLNYLLSDAEMEIQAALRTQQAKDVEETQVDFSWMSNDFKAQLDVVNEAAASIPPVPYGVLDPDDSADVARYESEKKAYDEAVDRLQAEIEKLSELEGWTRLTDIVKSAGVFDPETTRVVKLDFFTQPPTGTVTVASLMGYPPLVVDNLKDEFKLNKEQDTTSLTQVRTDVEAKQTQINDLETQLSDEQSRHTQDVDQLRGELSQANETAERNRLDATNAMQEVARLKDESARVVAERESRISALENRIRIDKQTRDLEIRRDDPDGLILTASPTMGTAVINLGAQDKVYPGLRFVVSRIGRGGVRAPKGTVVVTKVLDRKSAKVAIVDQVDPRNAIIRGDLISNPFFSPREEINIVIVGELTRYPIEIAKDRLGKMNVKVQSQVDGDTDYIVVPDTMAAPPPAAAEGDDEEESDDEGGAGAQTELDRIQSLARTFGATIITERMLNQFLSY